MPSFQATFVRTGGAAHSFVAGRLRASARTNAMLRKLWNVAWDPDYPWVAVSTAKSGELPSVAAVTSAGMSTEAVALEVHTGSDSIAYHFYQKGEPVRSLVYGFTREACWEMVTGHAMPWEASVLATEPSVSDVETSESANRIVNAAREFHGLPSSFRVERTFGPPWPLRLSSLLW